MNNVGNTYSWGSELGRNFANGISAAIGWVRSAASAIANAARSFLHFTEPDEGPLVGFNDWGYEMGQNYATAMEKSVPLIKRARDEMANAADIRAAQTDPMEQLSSTLSIDARAASASARPVPVSVTASVPTAQDMASAFVAGIQRAGGFTLLVDDRAMAGVLAPAMDIELGNLQEWRAS